MLFKQKYTKFFYSRGVIIFLQRETFFQQVSFFCTLVYLYFREKVECVSKIFCRRQVWWVKQTNTYDWGLDVAQICIESYLIR